MYIMSKALSRRHAPSKRNTMPKKCCQSRLSCQKMQRLSKDHHCKRSSHPKHFKIFKGQKLQILRILFFVFFNHSLWHVSENRSKNVSAYPHVCPARRSFSFSLQCPMVTVVTVSQGSKALRTRFPCYHWCSCPSSAHWWKWEMPTQRRCSERCSPRHC